MILEGYCYLALPQFVANYLVAPNIKYPQQGPPIKYQKKLRGPLVNGL